MQSLGNIFNSKGRQSALMRGVIGAMAIEEANKLLISIFGENARRLCQVVSVKNKILTLACLSSVLLQDIKTREREIISSLNKKLGGEEVEKMRFLE